VERRAFPPSARGSPDCVAHGALLVVGAGALDLGLLAVTLTLPRAPCVAGWRWVTAIEGGRFDRLDLVRAIALLAIPCGVLASDRCRSFI
jgi:hypothetical protein